MIQTNDINTILRYHSFVETFADVEAERHFFIEVYKWIDNFSYNYFESKYWNRFHWKYSFQINKLNKMNFWFPILYTKFPLWWMNITRWGQGFNFENKFWKGIQDLPDSLKSIVIDQMEKEETSGQKKIIFEYPQRDFL